MLLRRLLQEPTPDRPAAGAVVCSVQYGRNSGARGLLFIGGCRTCEEERSRGYPRVCGLSNQRGSGCVRRWRRWRCSGGHEELTFRLGSSPQSNKLKQTKRIKPGPSTRGQVWGHCSFGKNSVDSQD